MQKGQPVTYASRSLTDTEKHYAQIKKELLAIVFGTEKFNRYTYDVESSWEVTTSHWKPSTTSLWFLHPNVCRECSFDYKSMIWTSASNPADTCTWQTHYQERT